jgi:23S rRNA (uracil1939-C5)-methyltransferase
MRKLVMGLSIVDRMPQIEIAVGEPEDAQSDDPNKSRPVTALVFRNLKPFTTEDEQLLRIFADQHQVWIWLQPKGIETVAPFYPETGKLCYRLPEFEIEMPFKPADFTQVNHMMNRALVSRAIRLLEVQSTDRVLDLFCGIGNFTLPLARKARPPWASSIGRAGPYPPGRSGSPGPSPPGPGSPVASEGRRPLPLVSRRPIGRP